MILTVAITERRLSTLEGLFRFALAGAHCGSLSVRAAFIENCGPNDGFGGDM